MATTKEIPEFKAVLIGEDWKVLYNDKTKCIRDFLLLRKQGVKVEFRLMEVSV